MSSAIKKQYNSLKVPEMRALCLLRVISELSWFRLPSVRRGQEGEEDAARRCVCIPRTPQDHQTSNTPQTGALIIGTISIDAQSVYPCPTVCFSKDL